MDEAILIFIQENIRTDLLTPVLMLITNLGHYGAIWLVIAVLLAIRPQPLSFGEPARAGRDTFLWLSRSSWPFPGYMQVSTIPPM
nr:hypothetical protein [Selenomonas caprae]